MGAVPGNPPHRIVVVGGGAAGFFAAITAAETNPSSHILLLERGAQVLAKVKVSGGGRCNVTHACFDPAVLVTHYPRGGRALRGPFSRFQPRDTVEWFESRGVPLKTEADGRMFPVSDRSESIIHCLQAEAAKAGVTVRINAHIQKITRVPSVEFRGPKAVSELGTPNSYNVALFRLGLGAEELACDRLILATGSNVHGWEWARALGHTLVPPVPSLFTLTIHDPRLEGLAGLSVKSAEVAVEGTPRKQKGPVLITHEGLSGPAVIKLSAWAARDLHAQDYHAHLHINWTGEKPDNVMKRLKQKRELHARNLIAADNLLDLPRRLWVRLASAGGVPETARWGEVGNDLLREVVQQLTDGVFAIRGKSAFKEEFVTCGGVPLDEVDFRTMESKRCPGLYFAGEVLDIDGETGGFNFQNAWTTGWIAGRSANLVK